MLTINPFLIAIAFACLLHLEDSIYNLGMFSYFFLKVLGLVLKLMVVVIHPQLCLKD